MIYTMATVNTIAKTFFKIIDNSIGYTLSLKYITSFDGLIVSYL